MWIMSGSSRELLTVYNPVWGVLELKTYDAKPGQTIDTQHTYTSQKHLFKVMTQKTTQKFIYDTKRFCHKNK